MHSIPPSPPAIYHHIQEKQSLKQHLSETTEKIMRLSPKLILGESNLFNYDKVSQSLTLSPSFQSLLKLLIQLEELDPEALKAESLYQLNTILQQSQGIKGGFLRKEGTERWDLEDNVLKQNYYQTFNSLFQELGFVSPKSIDFEVKADHNPNFGARVERMEKRIREIVLYLEKNLEIKGNLFLSGSNRKLIQEEKDYLKSKLENLEKSQKNRLE